MEKVAKVNVLDGIGRYGSVEVGNIEIGFRESAGKTLADALDEAKRLGADVFNWAPETPTSIKYSVNLNV